MPARASRYIPLNEWPAWFRLKLGGFRNAKRLAGPTPMSSVPGGINQRGVYYRPAAEVTGADVGVPHVRGHGQPILGAGRRFQDRLGPGADKPTNPATSPQNTVRSNSASRVIRQVARGDVARNGIPHPANMARRFFPFVASPPGLQSLTQRINLAASAATPYRMRGKRTAHGRHRSAAEALQRPVLRCRQHLRLQ